MKKLLPILVILIAAGAGGAVFYAKRGEKEAQVNTLQISRGTIIDGVRATGTLQAVTTVTVGAQVSGIVQELGADFNDIVKKGQVIARLEPSILESQLETAKANLTNAQANLERQRVALADAQQKLARARELAQKQLINKVDLENAEVTAKQAEAQLKSTESTIVQSNASVNKAQVDLSHTIITAPINGIIINRKVDRGQTVNAGMSAPELFTIAADLTQMQVNANVDETDVGRMRPGQEVSFNVDAYPTETFHGTVRQVRLNPTTVQNVVTYSTVIDVPNPDYKLKPGMTANATIEIARRDNVLRVPNAAIRFRPTKDIFDALHQTMPPELERGFGRGNRGGQQNASGPGGGSGRPGGQPGASGPQGAPAQTPSTGSGQAAQPNAGAAPQGQAAVGGQGNQDRKKGGNGQRKQNADEASTGAGQGQQARADQGQGGQGRGSFGSGGPGGGGRGSFANMTPEERQKAMEERLKNMTPEQRAQFEERRKQREASGGGQGSFGGGRGQGGGNSGGGNFGGRGGQGQGGSFRGNQGGGNVAGGQGDGGSRQGQARDAGGGSRNRQTAEAAKAANASSATTIDALFGPLQTTESRGRVWLYINKQLKSVELRLGITDGTFTEVLNDPQELSPNTEVVTSIITPEMQNRPAGTQGNQANNPLMPQRGRGGPGGGPGGGGGRGGGR
jgi:HlyD family secretion protein